MAHHIVLRGSRKLSPISTKQQSSPTSPRGRISYRDQLSPTSPLTDLSAYPVLTEEVGYPPSPLARPSGGAPGGAPSAAPIGQIATKAIADVLGWKPKAGDSKGFLGALTQSFTLTEVEGHVESEWKPRTYAIQTDLAGGITGAQASIYSRGKDALDQSLPLLDGLYTLDPEAVVEDVTALKAVVKGQLTELVNELGFLGGPRVTRVNQYFGLLIGSAYPTNPATTPNLPQTDPDQIGGTLGNLRDELGLNFKNQDFVNSVEDEQNLSNYRIISDYVTSLAQSWLNNLAYLTLDTTTPFFGTQLVLLSRQLSVVAESVDEVRFTLDSVFVGPAERQTVELNSKLVPPFNMPPIFLEDLLSWISNFATEEGPRLIQDGGKFGVQNTFYPVAGNLLQMANALLANVAGTTGYTPPSGLPPGMYAPRVVLSIGDLNDQIQALVNLAQPIEHTITPEPVFDLSVLGVIPRTFSRGQVSPSSSLTLTITGTGFLSGPGGAGPGVNLQIGSGAALNTSLVGFSENRLLVQINNSAPVGTYDVIVTNPGGGTFTLSQAFTVTP